jgi:hypothetical protein
MIIALIGAITTVDSVVTYPLGAYQQGAQTWTYDSTYGFRRWKYVLNDEASTAWAAGTVVMNKTTSVVQGECLICATSTSAHRVQGVAQHAIAAQYWGWIQVEGLGLIIADTGGFTADTGLIPGNAVAGTADDVGGATAVIFAVARATTLATATGICEIRC